MAESTRSREELNALIAEEIARQAAWESSPEGVWDRLGAGRTMMAVCEHEMCTMIVLTVIALPKKVQKFVYEKCIFATTGGAVIGQVLSPKFRGWIILLDGAMTETHEQDEVLGIIAHEIAHAYLKHDLSYPGLTAECEREAASQTAAWGFSGIGADPDHWDRLNGR